MTREQLEHIIRAAGSIADAEELVIIGSQAILGAFPDAPSELTISEEVDTYPLKAPDKADLIDGSIGEKSPFHSTFGYYAHGVGPETAVLPANWRLRAVPVKNENTRGITGFCISPADLAISKLAAGREKDFEFVKLMLKWQLIRAHEVRGLLKELQPMQNERVGVRLERCIREISSG